MLKIVYLYLDVILSLYEENNISDKDFYHFVDLLHDEMREYD